MIQVSHNAEPSGDSSCSMQHYRKGEVVFSEGDEGNCWFEVISGTVRTCLFDSNGYRQVTGFHYAGEVFGFDRPKHTETAEAVGDTTLKLSRRNDPRSLAEVQPTSSDETGFAILQALENARRSIFVLGRKTATSRVAAFLISTRERLGSGRRLVLPMSRSDIGDHLGLTLHTVSRTISDLAKRRVIVLHGPQSLEIVDLEALNALAGEEKPDCRTGLIATQALASALEPA